MWSGGQQRAYSALASENIQPAMSIRSKATPMTWRSSDGESRPRPSLEIDVAKLAAGSDAELLEDLAQVVGNGRLADEHGSRDLAVGGSRRGACRDLTFL